MSDLTLSFGAEETVTPVVEKIADEITDLGVKTKKAGEEATKAGDGFTGLGDKATKAGDGATKAGEGIAKAGTQFAAAQRAAALLDRQIEDLAYQFGVSNTAAAKMVEQNAELARSNARVAAEVKAANAAQGDAGTSALNLNQALEVAQKAWQALAVPIRIVSDYLRGGIEAARAAEQAERALVGALGDRAAGVSQVAEAVQRATGADADALKQQAAVLASYGLTADQVERALPALSAYAQVTGKDMTRAVMSLGKALETGDVNTKIAEFEGFAAAAAAQAEGFSGQSIKLAAALGELQEAVGRTVTGSDRLAASLGVLTAETKDTEDGIGSLGPVLGDMASDALPSLTRALEAYTAILHVTIGSVGTFWRISSDIAGVFGDNFIARGVGGVASAVEGLSGAADTGSESLGNLHTALEALDFKAGGALGAPTIVMPSGDDLRKRVAQNEAAVEDEKKKAEEKKKKEREKAAADAKNAKEKEAGDSAEWFRQIQAREEKEQQKEIERKRDFEAGLTEIAEEYEKDQRDLATKAAKAQATADEHAADAAIKAAEQEQRAILDTIGDVQSYANAGASAMDSFMQGMHGKTEKERRGGMLSLLGTILGGLAGGLTAGPAGILAGAGAGGAVGGFLGKFRDGGPITALPKARGGALVIGDDMDADGRLIEGHVGEVMLNRGAVNRNGGASEVNKQNTGTAPPLGRGRGGGDTYLEINSLDPQTALAAAKRQLEPISVRRMENRQGRLTSTLGRRLRRNRSR